MFTAPSPRDRALAPVSSPARVAASLALAVGALASCGGPSGGPSEGLAPTLYAQDTHIPAGFTPNPDFEGHTPAVDRVRQAASVEGDIVVVPGDARVVTAQAPGEFGVTPENQRNILADVLAAVPDRFDTLVIFTAFEDRAPMTRSYYQPLKNQVSGIGLQLFNQRAMFGLPDDGRLSGYVGMNSPLVWGGGSLSGLDQLQGDFHAAIARELAHRWAFFLRFQAPTGMPSLQLLGANATDWSSLAQSGGSIQGGNLLERTDDPEDGMGFLFYSNEGTNRSFSPFDLYAMGRLPPDRVPVIFYLSEASVDGDMVDRTSDIPAGSTIRGRPILVNVQQVIDAMGPRQPSAARADPYYRVAFAFVTTPGADRSAWAPQLELLERVRARLPESWRAWGAGNLCTRIASPCPEPNLALGDPVLEDDDGLVAPGEQVGLRLAIENTGIGAAEGVEVRLRATSSAVSVSGGPFTAPAIAQNDTVTLSDAFMVSVSSTVACGGAVTLRAEMRTREGPVFEGEVALSVGTNRIRFDPMEESVNWRVDPEGTDSASSGAWALGDPDESSAAGILAQPEDDHTPGEGKLAFFTGPTLEGFFASNDLDDGRTTLESPIFALSEAEDPTLVFWAWRSVWDFSVDPVTPLRSAPLVVQVSNDGGMSYTELGRFEMQTEDWTRVSFRIADAVEATDRTRFRFVVEETEPANVEVGIDDLEILDFLGSCRGANPDPDPDPDPMPDPNPNPGDRDGDGCRCAAPPRASLGSWAAVMALFVFAGLGRRRAR